MSVFFRRDSVTKYVEGYPVTDGSRGFAFSADRETIASSTLGPM